MSTPKEYFAFISYQRQDEKWADWLRKKLEHFRLPAKLRKQDNDLPKEIRPVFRDMLELSSGVLAEEIREALSQSKFLIVICSPNSAKSPWVDKEVKTFIELGGARNIIPFIIDGKPFSDDPDTECFTPTLRSLRGENEILGINIDEMGREAALVKVVSRMFGLKFDTLWQRYEREKKKRQFYIAGLALLAFAVGIYLIQLNRTVAGQDEAISIYQGQMRTLTDKWITLIQEDSTLQQEKDRDVREFVKDGLSRLGSMDVDMVVAHSEDSVLDSLNVVEVGEGIYEVNGLRFVTDNPTDDVIKEWIRNSSDACLELIRGRIGDFSIMQDMVDTDPCLVYLILFSGSLRPDREKQSWFNLYPLMNDEQVMKLYNILYREQYKLASIDLRYEKKDAELMEKYSEVMSEYQNLRSLATKNPKYFYDLYAELQDTILEVYLRSSMGMKGKSIYEEVLTEALEDCEAYYRKNSSCKPRLVTLRNMMGAFKLNHGQQEEAVSLLESAYRLDREASSPYLARGYNSLAYKYAYDEDYVSALEIIEKAIALQPDEAVYYDSKGEFLLMQGYEEEAMEMWNKVLELDPEFLSKFSRGTALSRELENRGLID